MAYNNVQFRHNYDFFKTEAMRFNEVHFLLLKISASLRSCALSSTPGMKHKVLSSFILSLSCTDSEHVFALISKDLAEDRCQTATHSGLRFLMWFVLRLDQTMHACALPWLSMIDSQARNCPHSLVTLTEFVMDMNFCRLYLVECPDVEVRQLFGSILYIVFEASYLQQQENEDFRGGFLHSLLTCYEKVIVSYNSPFLKHSIGHADLLKELWGNRGVAVQDCSAWQRQVCEDLT